MSCAALAWGEPSTLEEEGPEGAPLEPVDGTIERLGAAFNLLMRWLGLMVRLYPEVKKGVEKLARLMRRDLKGSMKRTLNQVQELAGE